MHRLLILSTLPIALFLGGCQSETLNQQADPTPESNSFAMGQDTREGDAPADEPESDDTLSIDELLAEDFEAPEVLIADPFEDFNRAIFKFNDGFYVHILEPVSEGYTTIMPDPFEIGITNFFDNLKYPVRLVSYSLQGNLELAGMETGRFILDSTLGIAGFLRPSDEFPELADLPSTDLGLTFGYWGIEHGPYLIIPFLGPSSMRDLIGRVGDRFLDPVSYLDDDELRASLNALELVNASPSILRNYRQVQEAAIDPYTSLKDFYVQYRSENLQKLKGDPEG